MSNKKPNPNSKIALPPLNEAQRTLYDSRARFVVAACGRQMGKTTIGSVKAGIHAYSGEKIFWVAPEYKNMQNAYDTMSEVFYALGAVEDKDARRWTFPAGGFVQWTTGSNPGAIRGATLDGLIVDEAAHLHKDIWFKYLRPTLAVRKGWAWFLSTPNGKNWFYDIFQNERRGVPGWRSFSFPSSMNPLFSHEEFEATRATTPEVVFRQEYLAEFIDNHGVVFRNVLDAVRTFDYPSEPQRSHRYVAGIDLGRAQDYTVISIVDVNETPRRLVAQDRFHRIDWDLQIIRLRAILERYNVFAYSIDETGVGDPITSALAKEMPTRVISNPVYLSPPVKTRVVNDLVVAFERREITIPEDVDLIEELQSYMMEKTASGTYRYSAPSGMHDDRVISLALANYTALDDRLAPPRKIYVQRQGLYKGTAPRRAYPKWG